MAKILIVDDDEMERLVLATSLSEDHELFFASNGRLALDVVSTEAIELVVTDLAMPEVNGPRFIRDPREAGEIVPVIAITGGAPEDLDLAVQYGAAEVFNKPIDQKTFLSTVDKCLDLAPKADRWDHR